MNGGLQNLSRIVSSSNGYLHVNRRTGNLQAKGSNFVSRLIVWIRFKTSSDYRSSIVDAKRKVMASMLSDEKYGENFRQQIESSDRCNGLFFNNKPLSARKVRRFIDDVTQSVNQSLQQEQSQQELSVALVDWVSGKGGTIASGETFEDNLNTMLAEKIQEMRDIKAADVKLIGVGDEIHQAALNDREGMARVTDGSQALVHVSKMMSRILDQRIANSRAQHQAKLRKRLSVSGLSEEEKQKANMEIDSSKIATMDELDHYVNQRVVLQVDEEFPELLQQVQAKHDFHDTLAGLPEIRKQLKEVLVQQKDYKMLSVEVARDRATELLNQWIESKQEALFAAQESQYASMADVLIKLTLQEPRMRKVHIQSFRQAIEHALDEVYAENRSDYEALGVDKKKLFSMLYRFDRRGVLFNRLQKLVVEIPGANPLFDSDDWQASDVKGVAKRYIESVSKPMAASYAKVLMLKGKIPDHIYTTIMEKVSKGYVWEPRFIAAANGLHINSLVDKDNQGFYELLDSPQVVRKRIGNKDDFVGFSLDDLLKSMLGPKHINNHKKRRQVIDRVLPKEVKVKLLNELDQQLQMVKSRVMNQDDVDALFQRGTIRFLRAQNINFEAMSEKQ